MNRVRRALITASTAALLLLTTSACGATGPASQADVCKGYDELNQQFLNGNGVFGNPLFRKTEDMADLADRYEGTPDLSRNADDLHKVADADSLTGEDLRNGTSDIADLCGHPFGLPTFGQ